MKDPRIGAVQRELSVVVPVFNEEAGLDALLARTIPVCEAAFGASYEIILVDDGSTDRSWPIIAGHADDSPNIAGVKLSRNYGHQLALTAGLKLARGDYVFVLDADLQDPPELLPQMLEKAREGYDVVYGQRIARAGETVFKRTTASLFYRLLSSLVDVTIPRDTGDFRLMTRRVVAHFNAMPERFRFVRGMVGWLGFKQVAVEYERDPRFAGETHYPFRKMLRFAVDAITSFSTIPLRFASLLGMGFGLAGLLALVWVGISWLRGGTVLGWTSIAALILIIGSMQLLMLGIFGEYLGRMYMESKQRPLYLVDEVYKQADMGATAEIETPEGLQRALSS
ncbi:MAG: glycosyltransferase family 2 protein [Croceibacterium sp.]